MLSRAPAVYRRSKSAAALMLGIYFVVGMLTISRTEYDHIFPIFSWNMFSWVPNVESHFDVRVLEHKGRRYDPPRSLRAGGLCPPGRMPFAQNLAQDWGEALLDGDARRGEAARRAIERFFLPPPARYELVEEKADPLTRFTRGETTLRSVSVFSSGESP